MNVKNILIDQALELIEKDEVPKAVEVLKALKTVNEAMEDFPQPAFLPYPYPPVYPQQPAWQPWWGTTLSGNERFGAAS